MSDTSAIVCVHGVYEILKDFAAPLATIIAASAVAGITWYFSWRQIDIARNKLRFDLFDRRLTIYLAVKKAIASVMMSGKITNEEADKFLFETREARWLLDKDIDTYFKKTIYHNLTKLWILEAEQPGLPAGGERSQNIQRQREIKDWLENQMEVIDGKFAPFLKLTH